MVNRPEAFMARKREEYLNFDSVEQWFNGLASKSKFTKENYLDDLIKYCEWTGKNPDQLKQERKEQLISSDIDVRMSAEKLLAKYANSGEKPINAMSRLVGSIRSFYVYNHMELTKKAFRLPKPEIERDYACPTIDDIRKMLAGATLRDQTVILTLFQSGLREGSLIQLRLRHIAEISQNKVPAHIGLKARELKGTYVGLECHTFLGRDAIEAINRYLDWRRRVKQENLTPESYLFTEYDHVGDSLSTDSIIRLIREACTRANTSRFTPHDFRRAFQTNLEAAGVPANWVKKMTGHKLSGEENPYSIPKIEQLREAYASAEPKLTVTITPHEDKFEAMKKEIMSLCQQRGSKPEDFVKQLQKYDPGVGRVEWWKPLDQRKGIKIATEEDIAAYERAMREFDKDMLKQEILRELSPELQGIIKKGQKDKKTMPDGNGHYESKIVLENELTNYLDSGWEFVASLNHEKYLVRREVT